MLHATPLVLLILLGGPPASAALEVPLSLQTGSSFYIPAMGASPAEVYWNQTSPPGCTGQSIISVMVGVAQPYTSQLLGRVDERLSNGSIVIRSLRPEDGGFYVVCAESTSTPVGTILLTVTEPRPAAATTEPELDHTTHNIPPATKISGRKSGDSTLLACYAYGFYPREIEVKWVRNGVEMPSEQSPILPNPDGTFQIKRTVEVQEGDDKNMYSCQVEHISLPEIVTVVYDEKQTGHRGVVVAVVALVVAIAAAVVIWVNKKHRQHQSLELQPCRGSSEEEAGQSPESLHKHLQQNGDTAVV